MHSVSITSHVEFKSQANHHYPSIAMLSTSQTQSLVFQPIKQALQVQQQEPDGTIDNYLVNPSPKWSWGKLVDISTLRVPWIRRGTLQFSLARMKKHKFCTGEWQFSDLNKLSFHSVHFLHTEHQLWAKANNPHRVRHKLKKLTREMRKVGKEQHKTEFYQDNFKFAAIQREKKSPNLVDLLLTVKIHWQDQTWLWYFCHVHREHPIGRIC